MTNKPKKSLSDLRVKAKPALIIAGVLLLGNILWFIAWLLPNSSAPSAEKEIVATIDKTEISRQQWMAAMEENYGKETLRDLVNDTVMKKAAKKYKIEVSKEEIDLELALMRSTPEEFSNLMKTSSVEQLRNKVYTNLLLSKVLTKDIIIKDKEVEKYYKDNTSLFEVPTSYRTNLIVVDSKAKAENAIKELKGGADFSVLAREMSIDVASASLGGDIGFVSVDQPGMDKNLLNALDSIKTKSLSEPIQMGNGNYGILQVLEVIPGQSFTFEEVKDHIKVELGMEQLTQTVAPESFWKEFKVEWFYGENK